MDEEKMIDLLNDLFYGSFDTTLLGSLYAWFDDSVYASLSRSLYASFGDSVYVSLDVALDVALEQKGN